MRAPKRLIQRGGSVLRFIPLRLDAEFGANFFGVLTKAWRRPVVLHRRARHREWIAE